MEDSIIVPRGDIASLQQAGIDVDAGPIIPVAQRIPTNGPQALFCAVLTPLEEAILQEIRTGNYSVKQEIVGGQGEVSRLIQSDDSVVKFDIAAKVVSLQKMDDWSQVDRLEREAAITRGLEIDGVVKYFAYEMRGVPKRFGEGVDTEYILYSHWLGMGNLAERFAERTYGFSEVEHFFGNSLAALGQLHSHGILHRDIKPRNVVELENGDFGLIDFGLSKKAGQTTTMFSAGAFIGTPAYAAPEIQEGKRPSAAADIYSACATAISMVLGEEFGPFTTPVDIQQKFERITFPKEYAALQELISAGLQADPTERMEKFRLVEKKGYEFGLEKMITENIETSAISAVAEKATLLEEAITDKWDKGNYGLIGCALGALAGVITWGYSVMSDPLSSSSLGSESLWRLGSLGSLLLMGAGGGYVAGKTVYNTKTRIQEEGGFKNYLRRKLGSQRKIMEHGLTQIAFIVAVTLGGIWGLASYTSGELEDGRIYHNQEGERIINVSEGLNGTTKLIMKKYGAVELVRGGIIESETFIDEAPADGILDEGYQRYQPLWPFTKGEGNQITDPEVISEAQLVYTKLQEKYDIKLPAEAHIEKVSEKSGLEGYLNEHFSPAIKGQN